MLAVVLALVLAGCGRGAPTADQWPADRTFYSTAVTQGGRPYALVPGTRVELRFAAEDRLDAQAGCNHLGGSGRIEDGRLVLGDLGSTAMGCDEPRMRQDTWLSGFLGGRPEWSLSGTELRLKGGDTEIVLADRKVVERDRPLAGTRWIVQTVVQGNVVSSAPFGDQAYLVFGAGDSVRGHTGCAEITGRAAVTPSQIEFSSIAAPRTACTGDQGRLQEAVLKTLTGRVAYRIEGSLLTLTAAEGAGLGLRAEDASR